MPRARIEGENGTTTEWNSKALRAYQRRTLAVDALIASAYLVGELNVVVTNDLYSVAPGVPKIKEWTLKYGNTSRLKHLAGRLPIVDNEAEVATIVSKALASSFDAPHAHGF